MKIVLVGVGCVGKTTIGKQLAEDLKIQFIDFDDELERSFKLSIERIKNQFLTDNSFRKAASQVLKAILARNAEKSFVLAMPPSGLRDYYWKAFKSSNALFVELTDDPPNIIKRIAFFDNDSKPLQRELTEQERTFYLREIKLDQTYFSKFNKKADLHIHLDGRSVADSSRLIQQEIQKALRE